MNLCNLWLIWRGEPTGDPAITPPFVPYGTAVNMCWGWLAPLFNGVKGTALARHIASSDKVKPQDWTNLHRKKHGRHIFRIIRHFERRAWHSPMVVLYDAFLGFFGVLFWAPKNEEKKLKTAPLRSSLGGFYMTYQFSSFSPMPKWYLTRRKPLPPSLLQILSSCSRSHYPQSASNCHSPPCRTP